MKTTAQMMATLESVAKRNMGKMVYTLFLMIILQSVAASALLFAVLGFEIRTGAFYALEIVAAVVTLSLHFGFATVLLRMVRDEFVTLGFLFHGFRKPRLSLPVVVPFLIVLAAVFFASDAIVSNAARDFLAERSGESAMDALFRAVSVRVLAFALLAFVFAALPFAFAFFFRIDNPQKTGIWAMWKSLRLSVSRANFIRLIVFAVKAAGTRLAVAIILSVIISFLSQVKSLGILVMILDFVYFLNAYTAAIRILLSVAVMYDSLTETKTGQLIAIEA
ncbi:MULTISPECIES: hypothetical protein [Treponema]|uniref:hypothetical protein n=1 Tax=Treponema TaxID=157 RepID=UPI00257B2E89|nr:hypothetical protein [Treponema sp.]MBQ5537363.1 hypothetical protein [Treponema sp.]